MAMNWDSTVMTPTEEEFYNVKPQPVALFAMTSLMPSETGFSTGLEEESGCRTRAARKFRGNAGQARGKSFAKCACCPFISNPLEMLSD
jgi:hypothetical protein